MSVPGPFTMSGRLIPNERYPDRFAITEALLPIISKELEALVAEGCEICIDEPSMSCYGYKEETDPSLKYSIELLMQSKEDPAMHPSLLRQF